MNNLEQSRVRIIDHVREGLERRYVAERRFKLAGVVAVLLGVLFLVIMFVNIFSNGYGAFRQHYAYLPITYDTKYINTADLEGCDYDGIVKSSLREQFSWVKGRRDTRKLYNLVSGAAAFTLRDNAINNPALIGSKRDEWLLLDDDADVFFKGHVTNIERSDIDGPIEIKQEGNKITLLSNVEIFQVIGQRLRVYLQTRMAGLENALATIERETKRTMDRSLLKKQERLNQQIRELKVRLDADQLTVNLQDDMVSYFVVIDSQYIKITSYSPTALTGLLYAGSNWKLPEIVNVARLVTLETPVTDRRLSDKQAVVLLTLQDQGRVESRFNTVFFTAGDSREPEQSGILSALKGSMYMLIVTLVLSFPIGISAAVYLEEFAPRNRWTDFVEININNLAAVPSIIFGLLGLAVFINFFGLPRSAPLVGGLVLTLMTLPTIIISGRAALKSVPPSIREAALGIGASKVQTVFYHVLPLALPGMLTGTIIGMAQALGESAPLLMIGMVAFIVDVPQGFTDPSTALPVQIYLWADSPERAFVERASAAIIVLLGFLVTMNALAVVLRKRFEQRW